VFTNVAIHDTRIRSASWNVGFIFRLVVVEEESMSRVAKTGRDGGVGRKCKIVKINCQDRRASLQLVAVVLSTASG